VLDETGEFSTKLCNRAIVDLDPFEENDRNLVQRLIMKHVEATGSHRGKWILERWSEIAPKFVKVFPHDYKRVLGIGQPPEEQTTSEKSEKEITYG
jgi:glutamate synthase domain-containing protein 3